MFKAKVLVVGPCESGKTWLANYLAEATDSSGGEYHPTQGVRVLEFESEGEDPKKGTPLKAEVELWDCSGSRRFESCWPAFWKDTTGVVLVFNPDVPQHLKEVERWYASFVVKQKLKDQQCIIFAHHKPNAPEVPRQPLNSAKLAKLQCVYTDLETNPETVRQEFNNFLINLIANVKDNQERVEQGIVNTH